MSEHKKPRIKAKNQSQRRIKAKVPSFVMSHISVELGRFAQRGDVSNVVRMLRIQLPKPAAETKRNAVQKSEGDAKGEVEQGEAKEEKAKEEAEAKEKKANGATKCQVEEDAKTEAREQEEEEQQAIDVPRVKDIDLTKNEIKIMCNAFRLAIWNGWTNVVDALLQVSPWLRSYPIGGRRRWPLHEAASTWCESDVYTRLLHHNGEPIHVTLPSPLEIAIDRGRIAMVKRLISSKAEFLGSIHTLPALYSACMAVSPTRCDLPARRHVGEKNRMLAVAVLLRAKATFQRSDRSHSTPLMYAVKYGQLHMVRFLLRSKADVAETAFGSSPLNIALHELPDPCREAMLQLLLNAGARE